MYTTSRGYQVPEGTDLLRESIRYLQYTINKLNDEQANNTSHSHFFKNLSDVDDYAGKALQSVVVKPTEEGLTYKTLITFTEEQLQNNAGRVVRASLDGQGIEFISTFVSREEYTVASYSEANGEYYIDCPHSLSSRVLSVVVCDAGSFEVILPKRVMFVTAHQVRISFGTPPGTIKIVLIG